jgi:DNA-binding IclR family transcriptional regulator
VARAEPGVGPQYPIESVDNALRLILLFRDRRSVRVSDAAKELGVAASTAHRLLAMLVHRGFVAQDAETRLYTPGWSMIDLGVAMLDLSDLRTAAWPYMAEFAAKVDETVSLGMLRDRIVIFVASAESHRPLRVSSLVGTTYPANVTAAGKALLAHLPEERLAQMYGKQHSDTSLSPAGLGALKRELDEVRVLGYATNRGESGDHIGAVSVPVWRGDDAAPVASLSVSMPLSRFALVDIVDVSNQLIGVADRIANYR